MLSQAGPRGSADMGMPHGEADTDATENGELESHEDRINNISGTPEGDLTAHRNLSVHRQLRNRSIVVKNPYEHMWEMFENHPQYHVRESPGRARALTCLQCRVVRTSTCTLSLCRQSPHRSVDWHRSQLCAPRYLGIPQSLTSHPGLCLSEFRNAPLVRLVR